MEPNQIADVASSQAGVWGTAVGAIVVAFLFVERYLSNRKGDNVMVKALTEDVARLENRLRDETKRADDNEDRADAMAIERNSLIREFADIKSSHERVLERLEWLTKQNDQITKQNLELVQQNRELTNRLNEFINRGGT